MSSKSGKKKVPVIIIDRQGRVRKSELYVPVLDPYSDPTLEDGDLVVPTLKRVGSKEPKRKVIKHGKTE